MSKPIRYCEVRGCAERCYGHGLCLLHYRRQKRTGDVGTVGRRTLRDRLLRYAHPEPMTGCWLWLGAVTRGGYGMLSAAGRMQMAHRIAYEEFVGAIPDGLTIDHLCNVPGCVNPAHLRPATGRDNTMRGRGVGALAARRTHCVRGHPFAGDNLKADRRRGRCLRRCAICSRERRLKYINRKRAGLVGVVK